MGSPRPLVGFRFVLFSFLFAPGQFRDTVSRSKTHQGLFTGSRRNLAATHNIRFATFSTGGVKPPLLVRNHPGRSTIRTTRGKPHNLFFGNVCIGCTRFRLRARQLAYTFSRQHSGLHVYWTTAHFGGQSHTHTWLLLDHAPLVARERPRVARGRSREYRNIPTHSHYSQHPPRYTQ